MIKPRLALTLGIGFLTACQGQIGGLPETSEDQPAAPATNVVGTPATGVGSTGQPLSLPPAAGMRRLTSEEFSRSMRDLVGASIDLTVEPDTRLDGFVKVGASRTAVSPLGTELYQKAAYQAVDAIWMDAAKRAAWIDCDPNVGASCAKQVIARFGRRAWRRPLTTDEVDRYANVAVQTGAKLSDPAAGLQNAMAGFAPIATLLVPHRARCAGPDEPSAAPLRGPRARDAPFVFSRQLDAGRKPSSCRGSR